MPIQFLCPSCGHPIEVDEEWSGQSVACPFCRNTVAAPKHSTYAPSETIPTARTVELEPSPPDPHATEPIETGSNLVAVWAFALSGLSLVAWIVTELIMGPRLVEAFGPNPTQQEVYDFWNEQVQAGTVPRWLITGSLALLMSLALWVAGLVCAILGVRLPSRRGLAFTAFAMLAVIPIISCAGLMLGS